MADDEIQIEVGGAVRRHIPKRVSPLSDSGKVVVPYDSPDEDPIPVFISEEVMKAIERHSLSDKEREVGGVLLGGFYRNDDGSFVEVTDFIEAERAKGTDISVTFTHETWERIHERIALRGDSIQIVGWYHSHPGLGVFMSKEDEFIHSSYFSDPWHVAIVHDPIYANWGCFKWADGKLDRSGGFHVFTEKSRARQLREYMKGQTANRQAAPRSASAGADRAARAANETQAPLWTAIAVLLLIQLGVIGWMVLGRSGALGGGEPGAVADEYQAAIRHLSVSDLSGGEEHLRRELEARPDSVRAYTTLRLVERVLAVSSLANPSVDRTNYLLSAGSELAVSNLGSAKPAASSTRARTPGDDGKSDSINADPAGVDPLPEVLAEYESAAATRAARIRRAQAIDAVAKKQWSREAVKWLKAEELRQIAYGRGADPSRYADRCKRLSSAERKIVDAVLGSGKK